MIKNYKQYIRENIHSDIDPYGEEDWDDENLSPVLRIARKQGKPYEQIIELYCSNNQLTSLEGIENLVNLRVLSCRNNQLTSLEEIENLRNLRELYCDHNQFTSLEGIENLVKLQRLDCSRNQLTSLEGIENLVNLRGLYCLNNPFSNDYKKYIIEYCKKNNIFLIH